MRLMMKKNTLFLLKSSFCKISLIIFFIIVNFSVHEVISAQNAQITKNLKLGDKDAEVILLQKTLNLDLDTQLSTSGSGSKGHETNYFGKATQNAVVRFQNKYSSEILIPANLNRGNGFVGHLTRNKINTIILGIIEKQNQQIATSTLTSTPTPSLTELETIDTSSVSEKDNATSPVITNISPDHGPNKTTITITGSHFAKLNTVITSFKIFPNIPSDDGKTLQFVFDNPPFDTLQQIRNKNGKLGDLNIPFYITIVNSYGTTTKPLIFTIQIKK
jgi:hypothetical protein